MPVITYRFQNAFDASVVTNPAHVDIVSKRVTQMINATIVVKAVEYITHIFLDDGTQINVVLDIVK